MYLVLQMGSKRTSKRERQLSIESAMNLIYGLLNDRIWQRSVHNRNAQAVQHNDSLLVMAPPSVSDRTRKLSYLLRHQCESVKCHVRFILSLIKYLYIF